MISRVAENLYWLGRYVERFQATARLLRTTAVHALDGVGLDPWPAVVIVAGEQAPFTARHGEPAQHDAATVLHWLTWENDCPVSVIRSVRAARENARTTRDVLSRELWEGLNQGWLWLDSDDARALYQEDLSGFYGRIRDLGHRVVGAASATMPADDALALFTLGQMLERADQTARALDVQHHALAADEPADDAAATLGWQITLLTCGARDVYFRDNRGSVRGARVADLLLCDPRFPRSVRFALREADTQLRAILGPDPGGRDRALTTLAAVRAPVDTVGIDGLRAEGIHAVLTGIVDGVAEVGQGLYEDLFDPPRPGTRA